MTIITGLSIVAFLAWIVMTNRAAAKSPARASYQAGDRVNLQDYSVPEDGRTLMMVVSSTCKFCTESMPFYRDLSSHRTNARQIIAVSTESIETTDAYLRSHGVLVDRSIAVARGALKVSGTPTLILLDAKGTVERVWHGRLDPANEAEVLAAWASTTLADNKQ